MFDSLKSWTRRLRVAQSQHQDTPLPIISGKRAGSDQVLASELQETMGEMAHSHRLLLALSEAAQAVQRVRSPQEVYQTVGQEIRKLGHHAMIFALSEDRTQISAAHVTFDSALLRIFERVTGFTLGNFSAAVEPGSMYEQVMVEGQTRFFMSMEERLAEAHQTNVRKIIDKLAATVGMEQSIYAPLRAGGQPQGMLIVSGTDLTPADVTAVTAFANQAAIALTNTQLYQETNAWAGELERRVSERTKELNDARIAAVNMMENADQARAEAEELNEELVHEIGVRRQAEEDLRESEARYRNLFDSSPEGIAILDTEGVIRDLNPAQERLSKIPREEIIGRSFLELGILPEEYLVSMVGRAEDLLSGKQLDPSEVLVEIDGSAVWLEIHPALVTKGDVTAGIQVITRDITERKQAESQRQAALEDLRRERDLARALEEAAATVGSTLDLDQVLDRILQQVSRVVPNDANSIMLVNEGQARVVRWRGYERFGAEGIVSKATVPVAELPNLQRMVETGEPYIVADTFSDPNWVRWPGMDWLGSAAGAPIVVRGEVIGFLHADSATTGCYTPRHGDILSVFASHAATAIDNARIFEEMEQLKAFHESIVKNMGEGIVVEGEDGAITFCNPAAARMLRDDSQAVVGKHWADLVPPDQQSLVRAATERRSPMQADHYELDLLRRDGKRLPVLVSGGPWRDPNTGREAGRLVVFADLSEQKRLEQQFNQAQKMEALGRLAGGVAHDFNNLLTVIRLSTRLVEKKLGPDDALIDHVERVQEASRRAADLIRQLLSFSRQEVIEPKVLDLNSVVSELSKMLRRVIGEDIEMATELDEHLWSVRMDPTQADQVLMNLAVNARDAMPDGGTLTIETANMVLNGSLSHHRLELDPGEYVMLTISDTGSGMSPEVQARIFEPFFSTKEPGKGTGLGLATVFGIVKQNGGAIWVYSEVGMGTCFKIYLPRHHAEAADRVPPSAQLGSANGTETILVVEDEADVRDLTVSILDEQGFQVLQATDGQEALRVAKEHEGPIHLVLSDMIMPRMYGRDLVEELTAKYPKMRALVMSGYSGRSLVRDNGSDSHIAFLPKPFTVESLTQKVRAVLDGES